MQGETLLNSSRRRTRHRHTSRAIGFGTAFVVLLVLAVAGIALWSAIISQLVYDRGSRDDEIVQLISEAHNDVVMSGFGVAPGGSAEGKYVLVVGGSRGIGRGAVVKFAAAGANVIGTSRGPQHYPTQAELAPQPLELASTPSVAAFFEWLTTDAEGPQWTRIDVLILGGLRIGQGSFGWNANANDMFEGFNVELFGRQRVIDRAMNLMRDVDDSRIIHLTSLAAEVPIPFLASYSLIKAAEAQQVKAWNYERVLLQSAGVNGGMGPYKTIMISWEASFVMSGLTTGSVLFNLPAGINEAPSSPSQVYPFDPLMGAHADAFSAQLETVSLSPEQAGDSLLWVATKTSPVYRYMVNREAEVWCSPNTPSGKTTPSQFLYDFNRYNNRERIDGYAEVYGTRFKHNSAFNAAVLEKCLQAGSGCNPFAMLPEFFDMITDYDQCTEFKTADDVQQFITDNGLTQTALDADGLYNPPLPDHCCLEGDPTCLQAPKHITPEIMESLANDKCHRFVPGTGSIFGRPELNSVDTECVAA